MNVYSMFVNNIVIILCLRAFNEICLTVIVIFLCFFIFSLLRLVGHISF